MRKPAVRCAFAMVLVLCGCPSSHPKSGVNGPSSVGGPDGGSSSTEGSAGGSTGKGGSNATGKADGGTGGGAGASGSAGGGTSGAGSTSDGGTGGGDGGGAVAATPSTPLAKLPDALATAICDAMLSCVGKSALAELTSGEDCPTRVAAELRATEFAYMDKALASGHVLYDSTELPACADGIRALGCDVLSHSLPQACTQVLAGNVAVGGTCSVSAECQGMAFCAGASACPSHCAALLAAGDACSGDNQCGDGLMCVGGQCQAPSVAGEACGGTSGKVCRLGFNCSGSTDTQIGKCADNASVQVGAKGDACMPGGALCMEGLSCVFDGSSAFHCEGPVAANGNCHLGLPKQCPADQYCNTTDATAQSTCKTLPGDGMPCALGRLCAAGTTCVQEAGSTVVCRALQPNDGACSSDAVCRSGHCVSAKCAPPPVCP